ncbi:hypothetical protein [Streptomyces sp. NPDC047976]|uniref:hypothetical protein n=1 Tax=Streptomyces sp. NPDC047976 TaxID=3155746 RepID=UPI00343039D7
MTRAVRMAVVLAVAAVLGVTGWASAGPAHTTVVAGEHFETDLGGGVGSGGTG